MTTYYIITGIAKLNNLSNTREVIFGDYNIEVVEDELDDIKDHALCEYKGLKIQRK